jgi:hypothetical protein
MDTDQFWFGLKNNWNYNYNPGPASGEILNATDTMSLESAAVSECLQMLEMHSSGLPYPSGTTASIAASPQFSTPDDVAASSAVLLSTQQLRAKTEAASCMSPVGSSGIKRQAFHTQHGESLHTLTSYNVNVSENKGNSTPLTASLQGRKPNSKRKAAQNDQVRGDFREWHWRASALIHHQLQTWKVQCSKVRRSAGKVVGTMEVWAPNGKAKKARSLDDSRRIALNRQLKACMEHKQAHKPV